jgi:HD superfamily phosphohydrolase YqeK
VRVLDLPVAVEYLRVVESLLPGKTLRHVRSVTEFMASFSDFLGIAPEDVAAAGLLHDYCKPMKPAQLVDEARRLGLEFRDAYHAAPGLLHGPVAAELCRQRFDIPDDVYEAIEWHTTGFPGLGRVGLALYVADYAEPLRERPEADEARAIVERGNFLEALRYVADSKLRYVRSKGNMDPISEEFAAWVHSTVCEEMLR